MRVFKAYFCSCSSFQIANLNAEIVELALQRDKRDEATEDRLVVYRHQSTNIQRKKVNVAESLQSARQELDVMEAMVAAKKRELSEKTGNQDIISSVQVGPTVFCFEECQLSHKSPSFQYKLYVNKLRTKSNLYKRKKSELEHARAEVQILERTVELLSQRFEEVKRDCRSEGRGVIEKFGEAGAVLQERPKTAKPDTTDIGALKTMVAELSQTSSTKRSNIQELNEEIERFHQEHKVN